MFFGTDGELMSAKWQYYKMVLRYAQGPGLEALGRRRAESPASMSASVACEHGGRCTRPDLRGGAGTLKVDGKIVQSQAMKRTVPIILQGDESFDIGSDTLTGVNDADYKPPFPLTAKFNKLTIRVDRPQLSPADVAKLKAAMVEKAKRD